MNKQFPVIAIALLCAVLSAKPQLRLPTQNQHVKFSWLIDTVNNKTEPNAAMLIPIKLKGCNKVFYMQFDLGSARTFFYEDQLKNIVINYPKVDSNSFAIVKAGKKKQEIIGTIGEDLIDGKILIVDYPRQTLILQSELPENLSTKVKLYNFMLMKGSILLPANLNKKETILFFDTGSSAFELLTSKATSDQIAIPNSQTETYPVKSWGRTLAANTRITADSLAIAGQKLLIKNVTYIEGASDSQVQQMLKLGIGGMIGNKLFLHSTLIIDTRQKKFGIIQH